jgi:hypothetical protein
MGGSESTEEMSEHQKDLFIEEYKERFLVKNLNQSLEET